jgi:hypothetical protein
MEMNFNEIGYEDVDWFGLDQGYRILEFSSDHGK